MDVSDFFPHLSDQSLYVTLILIPSDSPIQIVVTDLTAGSEVRKNVSRYHHTVYLVPGRGRSYNVSVSAVNSEGEGPPSTPITFTMDGTYIRRSHDVT